MIEIVIMNRADYESGSDYAYTLSKFMIILMVKHNDVSVWSYHDLL